MRAFLLIVVAVLVGCASPTVEYRYVAVPVSLVPPEPVLENIKSSQLQCLSDDTYTKLVSNHRKLTSYGKELRALLVNPD